MQNDQQQPTPSTAPLPAANKKRKSTAGLVLFLAALIILSIIFPEFFLFGAGAAVIMSLIVATRLFGTIQNASEDAAKKYSPAVRTVINIFTLLVGVCMVLITLGVAIVAFFVAFFTAHPVRS